MSSRVVPTVPPVTTLNTDALARQPGSGSARGRRGGGTDENTGSLSIAGSPLATVRIDELPASGATSIADAATMAAISGLGLGIGFLENQGARKCTASSTSSRHGISLPSINSPDSQRLRQGESKRAAEAKNAAAEAAGDGENSVHSERNGATDAATAPGMTKEWMTNAEPEGGAGGDDSSERGGRQGSPLKLKTVAHLPGIAGTREHIASYAEEHLADVSAEINSLSKVRRWVRRS